MMRSIARRRGERGATMVELALVLPFLLLLGLGTAEMGLAWVGHDRAQTAGAQAARVAAVSGSRIQTDRDVLLALQVALPSDQLAGLDRVVIFKPGSPAGAVPAGCLKPSGDGSETGNASCNTYTGETVRAVTASSMSDFGGGPMAVDRFWSPGSRKDTLAGPPDYVGVWLRTTHENLTGSFFGDVTLTKVTIFRIQPDLAG